METVLNYDTKQKSKMRNVIGIIIDNLLKNKIVRVIRKENKIITLHLVKEKKILI